MKWFLTAAYVAVIVAANVATANLGVVPILIGGLVVTAGTFFAGVALVVRDGLQGYVTRAWMVGAIALGAVVSAVTSHPAIAAASGLAFLVSELVDWGVFTPLRERGRIATGVVVSSLVASPVDTVLFLYLAGFGVTWQAVVGQVLVKTALALVAVAAMRAARAVPQWV